MRDLNLKNLVEGERLASLKGQIKKIFFFKVCGMGMGTCAQILSEAGFEVSGADNVYFPPMSNFLKESKIECFDLKDVDAEFLKNYDLIVVGNSVGRNSEAAQMIEDCGTAFSSFPSVLGEFILKDKKVIGIAGTHGKTTTTYYLTQILDRLGEKPGHFVGGILTDKLPSCLGEGELFVIESDEYDSAYFQKYAKFRQYYIDHLVLTSLEFDHADIYENVEAIEKEFTHILKDTKSLIVNNAYSSGSNVLEKFKKYSPSYSTYGKNTGPSNLDYKNGHCFFEIEYKNEKLKFETNIIGDQNILNLTSCILFCLERGHSVDAIQKTLLDLRNVKRRQEVRGEYKNMIVVDDFAHHPSSVDLTIDAIQKTFPDKSIYTVIEPSTSTARSKAFKDSFVPAFNKAKGVIVANPKIPTNAKVYDDLDYGKLAESIGRAHDIPSYEVQDLNALRIRIDEFSNNENSVLLVMGNRTILGLWQDQSFLDSLVLK